MRAFPLALLSWWCISLAFCWKSELPWPSALHPASPPATLFTMAWLHLPGGFEVNWEKRIFFLLSNEPIKSLMIQMLIPITNHLNLIFPAACVSVEKIPPKLWCHTCCKHLWCGCIFKLMFQNQRTPWSLRALKHWANSDGKHVVLLLNNVWGHNKWHSYINLHQSALISAQHISTRFVPGQTARLRWMRAAQVLQDVFVSSICRMGRSVFVFDSKASYNHGYEAAVWV